MKKTMLLGMIYTFLMASSAFSLELDESKHYRVTVVKNPQQYFFTDSSGHVKSKKSASGRSARWIVKSVGPERYILTTEDRPGQRLRFQARDGGLFTMSYDTDSYTVFSFRKVGFENSYYLTAADWPDTYVGMSRAKGGEMMTRNQKYDEKGLPGSYNWLIFSDVSEPKRNFDDEPGWVAGRSSHESQQENLSNHIRLRPLIVEAAKDYENKRLNEANRLREFESEYRDQMSEDTSDTNFYYPYPLDFPIHGLVPLATVNENILNSAYVWFLSDRQAPCAQLMDKEQIHSLYWNGDIVYGYSFFPTESDKKGYRQVQDLFERAIKAGLLTTDAWRAMNLQKDIWKPVFTMVYEGRVRKIILTWDKLESY